MDRSKEIIRTSVIGIVANVLLASFKAVVGLLASSVAVVLDAVNNLSDALSSVITIIGTKLSMRPADSRNPVNHTLQRQRGALPFQCNSRQSEENSLVLLRRGIEDTF